MKKSKKVYIASPLFSSGRVSFNIHKALTTAENLRRIGFLPFVPHLFFFWDFLYPDSNTNYWLEMDKEWLKECDILLRLDGKSDGADKEVKWAKEFNIPIYYSVDSLLADLHQGTI